MTTPIIEEIGGEEKVRELVERFYDLVEERPEGEGLRKLHFRGHGLAHARQAQFDFLAGFLGGRQYFKEKHGHMSVKLMHAHVPTSTEEAENWLLLMDMALDDCNITDPALSRIKNTFRTVALSLVNDLKEWGMPAA